jgi:hypothetical protein
MRMSLFKILSKLAIWVFPSKERSILLKKYHLEQIKLHKRDLEMLSTIRPRTEFRYSDEDMGQ